MSTDQDQLKRILPWLLAMALFMQTLDASILNTAIPAMARSLDVMPLDLRSALTSYALSLAIFTPISGWIADRFGTHRTFCVAIGIFMLGSLLCGLAMDLQFLVVARVIQGMGGALMMPVGRSTLVRVFPKSEIVKAMSFVTIPGLVGPVIGPTLGGFISDYMHWRVIFLVNLPIGAVGLFFAMKYMPDFYSERRTPMDWLGFFLFGTGVTGLSYALELLGEHRLSWQAVSLIILVSILFIVIYVFYALRHRMPVINVRLFKIRTFSVSVLGGFATRLGYGGVPFIMPLFYQLGFGMTPIQSGLMITPQALGALFMKALAPKLLHRYGYRTVLSSNTIAVGIILCLFGLITPNTSIWAMIPLMLLLGLCASLQFTSMNTLSYADLPNKDASMGTSISSTGQQLSNSFGVALAAVIVGLFLPEAYTLHSPEVFNAFNKSFVALGILTIISDLGFHALRKDDGSKIR